MAETIETIVDRLRALNKRVTPQRIRILEAVVGSQEHLDIEQIRQRAGTQEDPISAATVYRTMRMLVDEGFIKERHFREGVARFEYVEDGEHHDHLICGSCGHVTEFTHDTIERLQVDIAREYGYQMTGHKHEIYGICTSCQQSRGARGNQGIVARNPNK